MVLRRTVLSLAVGLVMAIACAPSYGFDVVSDAPSPDSDPSSLMWAARRWTAVDNSSRSSVSSQAYGAENSVLNFVSEVASTLEQGQVIQNVQQQILYTVIELPIFGNNGLTGELARGSAINDAGIVVGFSVTANQTFNAYSYTQGSPTLTNLGTLGGNNSFANAINSGGVIVGSSEISTSSTFLRGFYLQPGGTLQPIGTFGGNNSNALGINSGGVIVGGADDSLGRRKAFIFDPTTGMMTDLGTLGGNTAFATSINDSNQVVGQSARNNGNPFAFLWQNGQIIDLGALPGGNSSIASDINNSGAIVGEAQVFSGSFLAAFRPASGGPFQNLGSLTGFEEGSSGALAINDDGLIVGDSLDSNGNPRAVLFQNGSVIDLNTLIDPNLGFSLTSAFDVNNFGQIVGRTSRGTAFLATPIPEPTIGATGGFLGLMVASWVSRRSKRTAA